MIFGLGDERRYVLEFLAREPNLPRIVTADKNEAWGIRKTNRALIGAAQFNFFPDIEFYPLDIFDIDAADRLLEVVPKPGTDTVVVSAPLRSVNLYKELDEKLKKCFARSEG